MEEIVELIEATALFERVDPERNEARFYSGSWQATLFEAGPLLRRVMRRRQPRRTGSLTAFYCPSPPRRLAALGAGWPAGLSEGNTCPAG